MFRFIVSLLTAGVLSLSGQTAPELKPGFDVRAIDSKVNACDNFYQYACGTWLANNPIPADRASWGRFTELSERNQRILRDILETGMSKQARAPYEQKIGDYYGACMDENAIEQKGVGALKPELDRIAAIASKDGLTSYIIHGHRSGINAMFNFSSGQDFKDASEVIAHVDQGGFGLPERDYYFKTDAKSVEIRKQYVAHVQKTFELAGDSAERAAAKAKVVMDMETALAKGALDVTSRRDPSKLYHRMPVEQAAAIVPSLGLKKYLAEIGAPPVTSINVAVPEFFKALEEQIKARSLDDWKIYLSWHAIHAAAPLLPKAFVDENFAFYGKTLTGARELRPRWKRCVQYTDADLGEALGRKYVEMTFGEKGKQRMLQMVENLTKALEKDIRELDWMTPATKKRAHEKLAAIANKIGYPENWRDYTKLEIRPGDALGNSTRANMFEFQRQLNKIGKPVDKKEWFMSPPTVNAYYDPQNNNINFPAGILQPPFFDLSIDDAVNYGAIGAVIGHELTHGFDDEGGKFDAKGNLANWWTDEDATEFEKRTGCIQQQYGSFTAIDDLKVNGKLTLGENVADNGGLRIAYMALMDNLSPRQKKERIDGFTPEQRFFLGWGQAWCTNMRDEMKRMITQTDPHSLPEHRVNGTVSNMPEFHNAFGCKAGQPMVRANACRVW